MKPFAALSETDKKFFENWVREYAELGDDAVQAPLSKVLAEWNEKKQFLFDTFGQQLMLTREEMAGRDDEGLARYYTEQIPYSLDSFIYRIQRRILQYYYGEDGYKIHFNPAISDDDFTKHITYFFSAKNLSYRKYEGEPFEIDFPEEGKSLKINPGDKNIKLLEKLQKGFLFDDDNAASTMEDYRIFQSRVIQQGATKKELVLSIHPIDYVTMSDSGYNWTSCMNWESAGGYRVGTVEMMNSPYVIVAYVKGDNTIGVNTRDYKCLEWNSKTWRILVIADPEKRYVATIKAYPYENRTLEEKVLEWVAELLGIQNQKVFKLKNSDDAYSNNVGVVNIGNTGYKAKFKTNYMYNDFRYEHRAIIDTTLLEERSEDRYAIIINYSGPLTCVCCGAHEYSTGDWGDESIVVCPDCGNAHAGMIQCCDCGEWIYPDDAYYDDYGDAYCSDCWNERFTYCTLTDSYCDAGDEVIVKACRTKPIDNPHVWGTPHFIVSRYDIELVFDEKYLDKVDVYQEKIDRNNEVEIPIEFMSRRAVREIASCLYFSSDVLPWRTLNSASRDELLNIVLSHYPMLINDDILLDEDSDLEEPDVEESPLFKGLSRKEQAS